MTTLRLQYAIIVDAVDFTDCAIDGAGERKRIGRQGSRIGFERSREERIEGLEGEGVADERIAQVRFEALDEIRDQKIFEPGRLAARRGVNEPRNTVLGQEVLQRDERPGSDGWHNV